jgi:glycosyltransferase involved in cell wall biosynthesis
MSSVKVTVVIATCNRVSSLSNCLSSLEKQTLDRGLFEILVVNDGSTDETGQFLDDFMKETPIRFRYISHKNSGVSYSRNAGIDNAEGDYIAFTDDDCIVPPDWLEKMYQKFSSADEKVAGIGGPLNCITEHNGTFISNFIQFIDEFNSIPVLTRIFIWYFHTSQLKGDEKVPYLRTSNAIFRRSCLKEVGGFDVNFRKPGGEDPDLCYRLLNTNARFLFDKDIVVLHNTRESLASYFRSLRNYLEGETRKSKKRNLYNNSIIRRSYRFISLQKVLGIFLNICKLPVSLFLLFRQKRFSVIENISFPLIILISKIYSLGITVYFQIKYLNCKEYC